MNSSVIHLYEQTDLGELVTHTSHALGQRSVEHEDLGVAVVQEVGEFIVQIPVVDVDRNGPVLERTVLGDQVLGTVMQVEGNLAPSDTPSASMAAAKRAATSSNSE